MDGFWDGFAGNVVGGLLAFAAAVYVLFASRRHAEGQARRERSLVVATEMFRALQDLRRLVDRAAHGPRPDITVSREVAAQCEEVSAMIDARSPQLDDRDVGWVVMLASEYLAERHPGAIRRAAAASNDDALLDALQALWNDVESAEGTLHHHLETPAMRTQPMPIWRRYRWDRRLKRFRRHTLADAFKEGPGEHDLSVLRQRLFMRDVPIWRRPEPWKRRERRRS